METLSTVKGVTRSQLKAAVEDAVRAQQIAAWTPTRMPFSASESPVESGIHRFTPDTSASPQPQALTAGKRRMDQSDQSSKRRKREPTQVLGELDITPPLVEQTTIDVEPFPTPPASIASLDLEEFAQEDGLGG